MSSSLTPIFPEAIDSTMLLAYKDCPWKFWLSYCLRRKPRGESIHLVAGGAFAAGIEAARKRWYDDGLRDQDLCLFAGLQALYSHHTIPDEQIPDQHISKSAHRVAEALVMYCDRWPFATDALQPLKFAGAAGTVRSGIEFTFAIPLQIAHPDTGNPLLYAGRCDMLAQYGERGNWGVDEKTSKSLGAQWAGGFRLRGQFLGYAWAAREHGVPLSGLLVRGIGFLAGETRFEEALVYTPAYKIDRWYEETLEYIIEMIDCYKAQQSGHSLGFKHNNGSACASYGGCAFTEPCDMRDGSRMLAEEYDENTWTPLRKLEAKVND